MLLAATSTQRLLFVGGKGGVGKTTIASALAYARAEAGERVLLVSTDPAHNLGHLWEQRFGDKPRTAARLAAGEVTAVEIDPAATVAQHLAAVSTTMRGVLPERMHGQATAHLELARNAPGSHESAILERIADLAIEQGSSYDTIVFDTAPTGHTLRLLSLPAQLGGWVDQLLQNRGRSERFAEALQGLVPGGGRSGSPAEHPLTATLTRRRERFAHLESALTDPKRTAFVAVSVAEPVPVSETIELASELASSSIRLAATVINRRTTVVADHERAALESEQVARLAAALPAVPIAEVARLGGALSGVPMIARVAALLG